MGVVVQRPDRFSPNANRIADIMSRPARLIEMVHLLSGRRARTIEEIADRFEISERTAYRDLADLAAQHIPIYKDEHGYRLLETATLRPLNLTSEEHALLKIALYNPALRQQPALLRRLEALEAKLDAASSKVEETPQALQLANHRPIGSERATGSRTGAGCHQHQSGDRDPLPLAVWGQEDLAPHRSLAVYSSGQKPGT